MKLDSCSYNLDTESVQLWARTAEQSTYSAKKRVLCRS